MTHALTAHFRSGDFNAALLTDHAFKLHALVLTAQTLKVFDWSKDFRAEQALALWLKCPVVNGFRFFYFTARPRFDHLGRSQANLKPSKILTAFRFHRATHNIKYVFQAISPICGRDTSLPINCLSGIDQCSAFGFQLDIHTQGFDLFGQHVKRLRHTCLHLMLAIYD